MALDALKAQLALKRKALEEESKDRPSKYMRKGDIEKMRLEKERKEKEEKDRAKLAELEKVAEQKAKIRNLTPDVPQSKSASPAPNHNVGGESSSGAKDINLSVEEITHRLRSKGQPIRLFGETERERGLRLRALELIEEKGLEKGYGGNDFKKILEDVEQREKEKEHAIKDPANKDKKRADSEEVGPLDLQLLKTEPDKVYPLIYFALKKALKEWEQYLEERPEEIKRTMQGKLAAATQVQSAEALKPLFKQLKKRALPPDMLKNIAAIVHFMQLRQYQRANDAYLRLSIGNAPWPIGVTMVGIHERSAREKISSDQVAHVLNDEVSRKYIQSLKRLLTFSQTKYPPEDMSQLMG